jgi:hypothetical protein
MADPRQFAQARSISFDFDGVLASLVLGRRWAKTRRRKPPVPVLTPVVRVLKRVIESLSEKTRKPYPGADEVLRRLRSSGRTLSVLTSRADERIASAEHFLDRVGWRELFDRLNFNTATDDADTFKEAALRAHPVDAHVDDDPGTVARLAPLFPDTMFVYLDHSGRGASRGANVTIVRDWAEIGALFSGGPGP